MTVLGLGGRLHFLRPQPAPLTLSPRDRRPASSTYQPSEPPFWSGDLVSLSGAAPLPPSLETCFLHLDAIRRLSFYPTPAAALLGDPTTRLPLPPPECEPLTLTPLTPSSSITTSLEDWTLHLDPLYLDADLIERRLGTGMLPLCTGGGRLNFHHVPTPTQRLSPEIVQISNQLNTTSDLLAELCLTGNKTTSTGYKLSIKPLSYVLNTREVPLIHGTLDFAVLSPISLVHF